MLDFEELYESHSADVYRFAFWLSGDRYDAEDITSETFIRAWTRNTTIRTETLKAYLFTIARNLYLEQRRKGKRRVAFEDVHTDHNAEPDKLVESRFELARVKNIIQDLPEVDRAAFIMRVQHELPYTEIARVLNLSVTNVKVKVHRVRKKMLASRLEKEVT
ncbi:MAG: sigma-70 family RNA polymerase sigma factor [Anaerolineales bacterium]|nr:sigma-70 family RNA polymerase sigma factor [Anaerolineales bacterium]